MVNPVAAIKGAPRANACLQFRIFRKGLKTAYLTLMIRLSRSNRFAQRATPTCSNKITIHPEMKGALLGQYLQFESGIVLSDLERMSRTRRLWINGKIADNLNRILSEGDIIEMRGKRPISNRINSYDPLIIVQGSSYHVESDQQRIMKVVAYDKRTFHCFQDMLFTPYLPMSATGGHLNSSRISSPGCQKYYWALVCGQPAEREGLIRHPIMVSDDAEMTVVKTTISPFSHPRVYNVQTEYQVIDTIDKFGSLLRIIPHRAINSDSAKPPGNAGGLNTIISGDAASVFEMEQIRLHLAHVLKTPILGDRASGVRSYKSLHFQGWGHYLDFSKYGGIKGLPGGIPLFLHLRGFDFGGAKGIENTTVVNPLPELWKALFKVSMKSNIL